MVYYNPYYTFLFLWSLVWTLEVKNDKGLPPYPDSLHRIWTQWGEAFWEVEFEFIEKKTIFFPFSLSVLMLLSNWSVQKLTDLYSAIWALCEIIAVFFLEKDCIFGGHLFLFSAVSISLELHLIKKKKKSKQGVLY
jgi:hypothetical protein